MSQDDEDPGGQHPGSLWVMIVIGYIGLKAARHPVRASRRAVRLCGEIWRAARLAR